ncbi:hypothetical protein UFOVP407_30 [uncultured Caudovirales phage]|uniref:Uncharacterized protein n=1 Tax=uncultured Caudovirales phage TaxID=2100421 RepID=A0A6J5M3L8_9CAUD|nr:hypothetical protein UFOVP407_30 [uncultured Caudovirales phage]
MSDIPDHIGQEAVRLLNETCSEDFFAPHWVWPHHKASPHVRATARALMMEPPEPFREQYYFEARETWKAAFNAWSIADDATEAAIDVLTAKFREIAERSK